MRNSLILSSMLILFVPWYIFGTNRASLSPLPTSTYAKFETPYPTYQFASWAGGGTSLTNDSYTQEAYMPTASMLFPWQGVGYANWCGHANTTTTSISGSGQFTPYNSANYDLIIKYHMPFLITPPLDGYNSQCSQYSKDATTYHPDLVTYNRSGIQLNYNKQDLLRVDDMNFAVQTYRDLVNLKNNLNSANSKLLNYWYGLSICSGGI